MRNPKSSKIDSIISYLKGKNNIIGLTIFESWYENHDDKRGYLDSLNSSDKEKFKSAAKAKIYKELQKPLPSFTLERNKTRLPKSYRLVAVAASIVFISTIISSSYFISNSLFNYSHTDQFNVQVYSGTGSVTNHQLPDGTEVWLNAKSQIGYNNEQFTDTRRVWLEGEAYFDVAHNPEIEFLVVTKNLTTSVLGTKFNVKAYSDEESKISLESGAIQIASITKGQQVRLEANEQISFNNESGISEVKTININQALAWKNRELVFMRATFEEIARTFERWYGVKIEFSSQHLKETEFVYHFKDQTLEQSLDIMKHIYDFKYQITDDKVTIY